MDCAHCGEKCEDDSIKINEDVFCCFGCKTVFELFSEKRLDSYYELDEKPGIQINSKLSSVNYSFLDLPEIQEKFLLFNNDNISKVSLSLPQIHCSACIWLLENLNRLHEGVSSSIVNFPKKKASITFDPKKISLKELATLLHQIGYEPDFSLKEEKNSSSSKTLVYKIGIAGFCFGNIMLLAFPEYFGIDESFSEFRQFFGVLAFLLSLSVFFYSGWGYIQSALNSAKQKFINIDVPIALGMITLMARSTYEIFSETGAGYFDSLAGLVFFLLLGRWFQKKSYDSLTFDRDYKSYFPIAVNKLNNDSKKYEPVRIEHLNIGDEIEIRNGELIPADSILLDEKAKIDYSFVTGEAELIEAKKGELVYAGGRLSGSIIRLKTKKKVDNSYLTELWNKEAFTKTEKHENLTSLSNKVSKYFTLIILMITVFTALYWYMHSADKIWNAVTAVLIVACPCALALSVPFTLGSATRIFGKHGLYLKSSDTVEDMAGVTSIVFDKTGTITHNQKVKVNLSHKLSDVEKAIVKSLASNSIHPLSQAITSNIKSSSKIKFFDYSEQTGKGISGSLNGDEFKLGSAIFTKTILNESDAQNTQVVFTKNDELVSVFTFEQSYRTGLKSVIQKLKTSFKLFLLSGDNNKEKDRLNSWLSFDELHFNQSPSDKLEFVYDLSENGEKVMMLGDGLNDAGALKQSDFGVAISDSVHQFSPACDAILKAEELKNIDKFLKFSKQSMNIIKWSFLISFLYNIVGLSFAVTGNLSPIIAAILMPISSISVVLFSTLATRNSAERLLEKK